MHVWSNKFVAQRKESVAFRLHWWEGVTGIKTLWKGNEYARILIMSSVKLHDNNSSDVFWKYKYLLMGFVHEKAKMTLGNKTAWRFSLIPRSSRWEIVFKSGDNVIFRGFRGISDNNISVGTQSTDYSDRNMKLIHISVSLCEIDGHRWLKVLQGTGQTEGQVDFNILHPSNVEDVISFIVLWLF